MKTDKQFYRLFRACPQFIFELAGLPDPGPCRTHSESFKEISRTADFVLDPRDKTKPACVLEVQFHPDAHIYTRISIEMALAQQHRDNQAVQGIILFPNRKLDPATPPWNQIVQAVYLDEEIEKLRQRDPGHVLLDLLAPLYLKTQSELEAQASSHYHRLRQRKMPVSLRGDLLAVFESWILLRLKTQDRKKLAMFLYIPEDIDVTETVTGREMVEIGVQRGIKRGMQQGIKEGLQKGSDNATLISIRKLGLKHFGKVTKTIDTQIQKLSLPLKMKLFEAMMDMGSWKDVSAWIAKKSRA